MVRKVRVPRSPNNPLQRSVKDEVLGRGRGCALLDQVMSARVLERTRSAAERGRYTALLFLRSRR
jgi:hypothetical protein